VRMNVEIPNDLTAQQRKLIEEFAALRGEEVDAGKESFTDKVKKVFR